MTTPNLFRNKYRIDSARLKNWDYSTPGAYFITICAEGREYVFGRVECGRMILSEIGEIAHSRWREIPRHFPSVHLDEFGMMPNHLHGIVIIDKTNTVFVETPKLDVSTNIHTNPQIPTRPTTEPAAKPNWKSGSLGVIINQYKRICTIHIRKHGYVFEWQSRFHDHVIRNEDDLDRIRNYIRYNPFHWNEDRHSN
jgi:REP element-mobilizing transposase RayT